MEKEIKIVPPEGYEIDKEKSTFDCIKFKQIKSKRWIDDKSAFVDGSFITVHSAIVPFTAQNTETSYNIFNTEKQAKSALAMARISQIMANDARFGGIVTDKEWGDAEHYNGKYTIYRNGCDFLCGFHYTSYHFLAFHTDEQRDLFLKENEDLVRDYLMI